MICSKRFLYRGVNPSLFEENSGELVPKSKGHPFEMGAFLDANSFFDTGLGYDMSSRNATILHEQDSSVYRTSGISTTPCIKIAKNYATNNGKYSYGYIYIIDRNLLEQHNVLHYTVANYATQPKIPINQEIILVDQSFGRLPSQIINKVIRVGKCCDWIIYYWMALRDQAQQFFRLFYKT